MADSLKEVLEVAERNPVAFRRMCGDFAQLVPQLKKLVGLGNGELNSLLDQVSVRLTAESAASCFSGDEAVNLNAELDPNGTLAKNIKRFQFFCDLSSGMLMGATGLNVIKSTLLNGPIGLVTSLASAGATYAIRASVNRMPAAEVRLLDKMFRYGPVMGWVTTSPFDQLGQGARHMAQG